MTPIAGVKPGSYGVVMTSYEQVKIGHYWSDEWTNGFEGSEVLVACVSWLSGYDTHELHCNLLYIRSFTKAEVATYAVKMLRDGK